MMIYIYIILSVLLRLLYLTATITGVWPPRLLYAGLGTKARAPSMLVRYSTNWTLPQEAFWSHTAIAINTPSYMSCLDTDIHTQMCVHPWASSGTPLIVTFCFCPNIERTKMKMKKLRFVLSRGRLWWSCNGQVGNWFHTSTEGQKGGRRLISSWDYSLLCSPRTWSRSA